MTCKPPTSSRAATATLSAVASAARYSFCKKTGVDQGQLSRILSGKSDFSMDSLTKVLRALRAALVVQKEEALRESASPEEASRVLERAAR
jgi:transcriptional regulator with XRE-family HTH domain